MRIPPNTLQNSKLNVRLSAMWGGLLFITSQQTKSNTLFILHISERQQCRSLCASWKLRSYSLCCRPDDVCCKWGNNIFDGIHFQKNRNSTAASSTIVFYSSQATFYYNISVDLFAVSLIPIIQTWCQRNKYQSINNMLIQLENHLISCAFPCGLLSSLVKFHNNQFRVF